ncbi:hypothetical protein BV25DRAFT_1792517 [Artomyces pyxidatus]|uniref:Uncharacterized protein n=1 Tax=Artomyces pyxidatus TaxID=48021 RepID=A0ACB8TKB5_9AGAM|nr:hypothetical protein BV25DRAFT_1792517 [Artomyces pyxidatus]
MSQIASLQQAWVLAQPRLNTVKESLAAATSPPSRLIRVGQLDAELLDQELVHILRDPLSKALGLVHSSLKTRFDPELSLVIQLTLYRLSVWNGGASYGAKLQDLKYGASKSSAASGLPRRLLFIHGALTILIPYLHTRIRGHALSKAWPDAPSSDRRRKAWELLARLETVHGIVALGSFISFLWDGRYRTLVDRLLGMQLVPARRLVKRDVSYEFMNRQMVWHAFTEFLIFLLPLLPHRTLRRAVSTTLAAITHPLTTLPTLLPARAHSLLGLASPDSGSEDRRVPQRRGIYWHLPENECAVCYENSSLSLHLADAPNAFTQASVYTPAAPAASSVPTESDEPPTHPVTTPYRTTCGHTYCYACVAEKMLRAADEGGGPWECLRCAEPVRRVERVRVDEMYWTSEAEGSGEEWGSDYFDELGSSVVSGVSGSMGSRSWVSGSDEERSD